MEPIKEEAPRIIRLIIQRFCPKSTPVYCALAERVEYPVQPEAAGPPATKKLASITTPETAPTQKESMFNLGKAMSRVPTINGMRKLPKQPTMIGMTTKKIMIVACIVKSAL